MFKILDVQYSKKFIVNAIFFCSRQILHLKKLMIAKQNNYCKMQFKRRFKMLTLCLVIIFFAKVLFILLNCTYFGTYMFQQIPVKKKLLEGTGTNRCN